jgi:hypothetical protein
MFSCSSVGGRGRPRRGGHRGGGRPRRGGHRGGGRPRRGGHRGGGRPRHVRVRILMLMLAGFQV